MESKLKKKGTPPPRYDEAFKAGAVRMVTEQRREPKEVARDLGICIDILRSRLKGAGMQVGQVSRHNRDQQCIRKLEAELRSLRKRLCEKDEVIDILKKIRRHPVQTIEEKYRCVHTLHRQGTPVEQACGALEVSRSGYYGWVSTNPVGGNRAIRRFGGGWWSCTRSTLLGLDPPSMLKPEFGCSHKRAHRQLWLAGIVSGRHRAYKVTTNSRHSYPPAPNLLQRKFSFDSQIKPE